jgi:hypothetical protein
VFIGHFAVGLATKRVAPNVSLGTLFMAAQFADLLWPILLLLGLERVQIAPGDTVVTPLAFVNYPLSHSLLADIGWATLFAGLYLTLKHHSTGALWIWIAVISHWILDAVAHRSDLPFYPGSRTLIGLGLWNSLAGTLAVEGTMFFVGLVLYLKSTRPKDRVGVYAFLTLVVVLLVSYVGGLFGPPPPNIAVLETTALSMWLFVPWAYWADRHRRGHIAGASRP